jgi:hypothetical protein
LPINEDEREEISFILEYNKNRREEQLWKDQLLSLKSFLIMFMGIMQEAI